MPDLRIPRLKSCFSFFLSFFSYFSLENKNPLLSKNTIFVTMKKYIYLLLFSTLLAACNSPKALYKKGMKLESKDLHEQACNYFIQSLDKKSEFVDSQIALKKSGQKVVNYYLDEFFKAKNYQEKKASVYHYRSAFLFQEKVKHYNIHLDIPGHYTGDFNIIVDEYVKKIYEEALSLLKNEKFDEAELVFKEVSLLKPSYKDVNDLQNVATYEPMYRAAVTYLETEKFRTAYYQFAKIPFSYKDTEALQAMSLEAGLFTIGLMNFENATNKEGGESSVSAYVSENILSLHNPFVKLLDRTYTQTLINEQLMGLSGQTTSETAINAGELIGVKAILTGKLLSFSKEELPLRKQQKKAWYERRIKKYNPETEKHYYENEYDKIFYYDFYGSTSVEVSFQYQLISTESGEILLTDIIRLSDKDEIHYGTTNQNYQNIVPGYWKWQQKSHPSDEINTSFINRRNLKQLFKNSQKLKPTNQLADELFQKVAQKIAQNINSYNPEN